MLIRASHRRNSLFSTYSHGNNYVLEVGAGGSIQVHGVLDLDVVKF